MFELIRKAWEWIKKIVLAIIRFVDNIVSWFENPARVKELEKDMDNIAVVVREKLKNGNYNMVKCLFNKKKGKIVGKAEAGNQCAEGMESSSLDAETERSFGNKDMIVLE